MAEPTGPVRSKVRLKLVERPSPELHGYRAFSLEPPTVAAALMEARGAKTGIACDGGCLISSPDAVISRRLREQTRIVLATLTRREQLVLRLRFGIAQTGDQPLEKIDDVLTPSQMAFIEATALRKLRHPSQGVRLRSVDRR